jgi:hypothetical protein
MKRLPKLFLIISMAGFGAGAFATLSGADLPPAWAAGMPFGAIFLGLFLIALILQNEMAKFDQDEKQRREVANRHSSSGCETADVGAKERPDETRLAAAHSH